MQEASPTHHKRPEPSWAKAGAEPSLEALLADPVRLALLASNGGSVQQLREFSIHAGERLLRRRAFDEYAA